MIDPVPSGIRNEGEMPYGIPVDLVVELEEDTEAGVCKDGICGFGENVVVERRSSAAASRSDVKYSLTEM